MTNRKLTLLSYFLADRLCPENVNVHFQPRSVPWISDSQAQISCWLHLRLEPNVPNSKADCCLPRRSCLFYSVLIARPSVHHAAARMLLQWSLTPLFSLSSVHPPVGVIGAYSWGLLPLLTHSPGIASEHAAFDTYTLFSGLSKAARKGN